MNEKEFKDKELNSSQVYPNLQSVISNLNNAVFGLRILKFVAVSEEEKTKYDRMTNHIKVTLSILEEKNNE